MTRRTPAPDSAATEQAATEHTASPEQATSATSAPRMLRIAARPAAGFYRAQRYWPSEPTLVRADEFSAEQLEALRSEPNLVVEEQVEGAAP